MPRLTTSPLDFQLASCVSLGALGLGKAVAALRHAIGDKRIEHSIARVDGFTADDATRVVTELGLKPGGWGKRKRGAACMGAKDVEGTEHDTRGLADHWRAMVVVV